MQVSSNGGGRWKITDTHTSAYPLVETGENLGSERAKRLSEEPNIEGSIGFIEKQEREVQRELKATKVIVALLGAGGGGLEERRRMAEELSGKGVMAIVPEDVLTPEVGPSILERRILSA